jgi:hypothetical protein
MHASDELLFLDAEEEENYHATNYFWAQSEGWEEEMYAIYW